MGLQMLSDVMRAFRALELCLKLCAKDTMYESLTVVLVQIELTQSRGLDFSELPYMAGKRMWMFQQPDSRSV